MTPAPRTQETAAEPKPEKRKDAPYYCPGCGRRYNYQRECTGYPASGHAPIEVVSTDELDGDGEPTAAPATG
jgi:hypothetical protein